MTEHDAADQATAGMAVFARRLEAGRLSMEYVFDHTRPDITDYTAAPEYRRYQPRRHRQRDRRAALGTSVSLIQHPTGSVCYALRRCDSAAVIGNVAASGMDARGVMMVGWSLVPAARGQGYGTEAALLLRDLLFCAHHRCGCWWRRPLPATPSHGGSWKKSA